MNKLQSQIVEMLLNSHPDALAVYCFGSWGTQHERRESDIDLAILPLQPLSPQARWETAQKLAQMFSRDVDLVDLRTASTVMKLQVIVQGERLYCRDEAAVGLFETTVFSEYARLNEERREILADIKAKRLGEAYMPDDVLLKRPELLSGAWRELMKNIEIMKMNSIRTSRVRTQSFSICSAPARLLSMRQCI